MNTHAQTLKPSLQQTLATPLSQPVKDIPLDARPAKALPIPKRLRNASVGMAIAYSTNVGAYANPVFFVLRNLLPLAMSAVHLLVPFVLAWFASHWTANVEEAIWSGSAVSIACSFAALWVVALMAWSIVWIAALAGASRLAQAWRRFANVGEDYLVSKHSQERTVDIDA